MNGVEQKFRLGQEVFYIVHSAGKIEIGSGMIAKVELKESNVYYTMSEWPMREDLLFASKEECVNHYISELKMYI